MALFKNLYFDIGSLLPFKKKTEYAVQDTVQKAPPELRDLPEISKRLLEVNEEMRKQMELPEIVSKPLAPPPLPAPEDISKVPPVPVEPPRVIPPPEEPAEPSGPDQSVESTFFKGLHDHVTEGFNTNLHKEVLSKDLFREMESYWNDKKEVMHNTMMTDALKKDIKAKINDLHALETEWQAMQLQLDKAKDTLASKEMLIESQIKTLKRAFKKIHLGTSTKPEYRFILMNGDSLKSLQELHDELKIMDTKVWEFHVNEHKNDFANWINDVMGLHDLAQSIRTAKSKEHMSKIIDSWAYSY